MFHIGGVQVGNHDRVHADGLVTIVLDRDLCLAVGPQPGNSSAAARFAQGFAEIVRVHDRRRHQLGRLRAGESEHQSLVACALFSGRLAFGGPFVHALGDVGALFDDGAEDLGPDVVEEGLLSVYPISRMASRTILQ